MFPEKIEIKGNQDTPGVLFDKESNFFQIYTLPDERHVFKRCY